MNKIKGCDESLRVNLSVLSMLVTSLALSDKQFLFINSDANYPIVKCHHKVLENKMLVRADAANPETRKCNET